MQECVYMTAVSYASGLKQCLIYTGQAYHKTSLMKSLINGEGGYMHT